MSNISDSSKNQFNWWKLAFFIALFSFEFTREIYVIEKEQPIQLLVGTLVTTYKNNEIVVANGKWGSTNTSSEAEAETGGIEAHLEKIITTFVRIECNLVEMKCTESNSDVYISDPRMVFINQSSYEYEIDNYNDRQVTYKSDQNCYVYTVTIDYISKTVSALKERRQGVALPECADTPLLRRFEFDDEAYPESQKPDAFLPIINSIVWVFNKFS